MNPDVLRQGRNVMNVVWVVLAVSFVLPAGPIVGTLRAVFAITLAAHVLEFVFFHRKLLAAGGSFGHHLGQVLLYGFFHIKQVELDAGASDPA
ncbi:MAG: DUF1145 domain-containing protein [Myxococcales bacterium]|nr:DUF1145 domain-containing protein [Myxococcales bacterium]